MLKHVDHFFVGHNGTFAANYQTGLIHDFFNVHLLQNCDSFMVAPGKAIIVLLFKDAKIWLGLYIYYTVS